VDDERASAGWRRAVPSWGWLLAGTAVVLLVVGSAAWLTVRGRQAQAAMVQLRADGTRLQQQLATYDLTAAGPTLTKVRLDAARARDLTDDPVWAVAGAVPVLGRDVHAARRVSAVLADLTEAARPVETVLPRLDPDLVPAGGGRIDTAALQQLAETVPDISTAVSAGALSVGEIDPGPLRPQIGAGVRTLSEALTSARGPLADAVPVMRTLPAMLGADGRRTWVVLLQQDAEARGTGGLVGAYAVLTTDRGRIRLARAESRATLDRGPSIPAARMPADLRALYGHDLTEWAGFNASPHFAWTGQLVAAGWKARPGNRPLDYVAAVDQYVVAAMLGATGPVTVRGVSVNQGSAVAFLSRDVYRRWKDPAEVDKVTTELVQEVFGRFTRGRFDLRTLVTAMRAPIEQRRLLLWAADGAEQDQLARFRVSGALPTDLGPFAMAVVNNGGGNKLDAYLRVHTDYQPGRCTNGTRVGQISVTLHNTAPSTGLPRYVSIRSDLQQVGITGPRLTDGGNRILLDVYGPVGSSAALTTLDGRPLSPVVGLDNNHTVWRVAVPIDAGQRRTVNVVMTTPAVDGDVGTDPLVLAQPMVQPATVSTRPLTACENTSVTGG
jgi:Protein of unknown function (DUF4012)